MKYTDYIYDFSKEYMAIEKELNEMLGNKEIYSDEDFNVQILKKEEFEEDFYKNLTSIFISDFSKENNIDLGKTKGLYDYSLFLTNEISDINMYSFFSKENTCYNHDFSIQFESIYNLMKRTLVLMTLFKGE